MSTALQALYCERGRASFSKMQAVWWTVAATVYVFTREPEALILSSMLAFPLAALGIRRVSGPKDDK